MTETERPPPGDESAFRHRMQLAACSLIVIVVSIWILEKFKDLLQPLFIAVFIGYILLPLHHWLMARRAPSWLANCLIVAMIFGGFFVLGAIVAGSVDQFKKNWPDYEKRADKLLQRTLKTLEVDEWDTARISDYLPEEASVDQVMAGLAKLGSFFGGLVVTFVYFLFLVAERASLKNRLSRAFGAKQSDNVLEVAATINRNISQYLAVKTVNGLFAATLTLIVLFVFGVDFYMLWALLTFVLNYIPYLGSMAAVVLPVMVSVLMFDSLWAVAIIAVLLVGIQEVIGVVVEPRMAGRRIGVSPLLIILSLSFWGILWGIVGMILAVPLLVVTKAVLENIPQTRPIAIMMSNE